MKALTTRKFILAVALAVAVPAFGSLTYTCDATIDNASTGNAGTCAFLNGTIAGLYNSTFNNVNANIYIKMGVTGLGQSQTALNGLSYSAFRADLTADSSGNAVDTAAIASLPASEPAIWGGDSVAFTSAIGSAFGIASSSLFGVTSTGAGCTLSSAGCYNSLVTITTQANLSSETGGTQFLYWRQNGGSIPGNAYDFYAVVQHETDEALGTSSCVGTSGSSLADLCGSFVSAVDLFRYRAGARVFIDTTPGAYFSFDGGLTNGAGGAIYNTLANGADYADYTNSCQFVQDAAGCLGALFNFTTDGGGETNILDAVGFNLAVAPVPEPATMGLIGVSLIGLAIAGARHRRVKK
jgi:hypothetical protein